MDEKEKYLEAAKLIANCKPSKLPYVFALLKKSGIEITAEELKAAKQTARDRTDYAIALRNEKGRDDWLPSDNPVTIKLRELYNSGKSIMKISRVSGVHKTSLYYYIKGTRAPNKATASIIMQTIAELYP